MKRSKRKKMLKKLTAIAVVGAMVGTTSISALAATTSNEVSQREKRNSNLSMNAATEGMVLLQNNNNVLPMGSKGNIALFGEGAYNTVKGGTGSGNVNQRYTVSVQEALEDSGYNITSSDWIEKSKKLYDEGLAEYNSAEHSSMWDSYSFPDNEITDGDIAEASTADTGIYVISRNSGEGIDRKAEKGDYYLTDTEIANIKKMSQSFKNSIVVLNVGGVIDTKFVREIPELDSILLMSQAGMEGGTALVNVLNGKVDPSGKLADTWAENYSDYPSSKTFSKNDGNTDQEDYDENIYVGYRYFDSFNVKPAYEFGYGLSYTSFDMKVASVEADANKVTVKVNVKNTGSYSGKEVAEVYFSAPTGKLDEPYQELAGYGKTDLLAPGQSQTLTISYDTSEMSSYSEADAAYIMEKGDYIVRVGNSSRNTHVAAVLTLGSTVTTEQLSNQMKIDKNINELSDKGVTHYSYAGEENEISSAQKISLSSEALNLTDGDNKSEYDKEDVTTYIANSAVENETTSSAVTVNNSYKENKENVDVKKDAKLYDVYNGDISMQQFVAGLSDEKLADIVEGIGFGTSTSMVGTQKTSVKGSAGETTGNYYDTDGIPNIILTDGPAGVRITQSYTGDDGKTYYQYATAWPVGSLIAQTWNSEIAEEIGDAIGGEMEEFGSTLWLAPGMNIHRNPLCGRNFEYYSEDPFMTGIMGAAATKGVQSHPGIGVTIKHFAGNNEEDNRSYVNDTISERAIREIYLKGFEMAVKSAQPMAIMSSYNEINSKFSGSNYDLLTDIARGEWKFGGLVMTDWFSNADPVESMHAGNDLIMPGDTQSSILMGLKDCQPQFGTDGYVASKSVIKFVGTGLIMPTVEQWNDFVPDKAGTVTVSTKVKAGIPLNSAISQMVTDGTAVVSVDNELVDTVVTTEAAVSATSDITDTTYDRTVTYSGYYKDNNTLYLGDLQKSAINVLNIIMQSSQFAKMNEDKGVTAKSYEEKYNDLKDYLTLTKDNAVSSSGGSSSHHNNSSSSNSEISSNSSNDTNNSSQTNSNSATTNTNNDNRWNKNADGTWSFINSNGQKAIGWVQDGKSWYNLDSSGVMQTGWFKDTDGKWYYLNDNGSMKTGWLQDTDGKWYYLNASGDMAVNTIIDGYTVDSTGAWVY